jgi:hypothetical protein
MNRGKYVPSTPSSSDAQFFPFHENSMMESFLISKWISILAIKDTPGHLLA